MRRWIRSRQVLRKRVSGVLVGHRMRRARRRGCLACFRVNAQIPFWVALVDVLEDGGALLLGFVVGNADPNAFLEQQINLAVSLASAWPHDEDWVCHNRIPARPTP